MKTFKQLMSPLFMLMLALSFSIAGCSSDDTQTVPSITTDTETVPSIATDTETVPSIATDTETVSSITTDTETVPSIATDTETVPSITTDTETVPSITTTDDDGSTSVDDVVLDDVLDTLALGDLSEAEVRGLLFMREEEKLAHDVYVYLFAEWGATVFDKISGSEQTHTDSILTLLDRYGIADPVGDNAEGVFVDLDLQGLYDYLVELGSPSLIDALYVGAAIEEIDILDIQKYVDEVEDNQDIVIVYENLMKGSRNHLRSFVKNLAEKDVIYEPEYLTEEAYDAIINSAMETN